MKGEKRHFPSVSWVSRFFAYFLVVDVTICSIYYIQRTSTKELEYHRWRGRSNDLILILDTAEEHDPNVVFSTCPEAKAWCQFTKDSKDHYVADAVLFHARSFKSAPYPRRPEQVYVWITMESPIHENVNVPEHYINWTMTYRMQSDVLHPYGLLEMTAPTEVDLEAIWSKKREVAAWLGSNCVTDNGRTEMIKLIRDNGLELKMLGGCGEPLPACGRYAGSVDCRVGALLPYKFYMALENSNCPDYVTEKLWNSLESYMAVPIVIKRDYYKNYEIPDSAYIAIDDYRTVEELVEHVNRVSNNKTEYLGYHQWRRNYRVVSATKKIGYCELCRRLRSRDEPSKSYEDLSKWFTQTQCEDRLLDKFLGPRTFIDRAACNIRSVFRPNIHWNCS